MTALDHVSRVLSIDIHSFLFHFKIYQLNCKIRERRAAEYSVGGEMREYHTTCGATNMQLHADRKDKEKQT